MFSKKNNKGFTLMEMLIVVAIIAILIAIMIPTFNAQLEKAREAADAANIRSAYAEAMVALISDEKVDVTTPALTQTVKGWDSIELRDYLKEISESADGKLDGPLTADDNIVKGKTFTFSVDSTTGEFIVEASK